MANPMKWLDPAYSIGHMGGGRYSHFKHTSPTYHAEKALPARSPWHLIHGKHLREQDEERKKADRKEKKEREWAEIRRGIEEHSYKPKAMFRGGRTRPVDGCAIKGKTKPTVF